MGFGYLFVGYLLAFLLQNTLAGLGWGAVAVLLGYGVMLWGFCLLQHYHDSFVFAKWTLLPMMLTALYDLLASFNNLFLWDLPIFGGGWGLAYRWVSLALITFFNFAMLYAIAQLAREVELGHIAVKAIRNAIFVGLFALLQAVANLPLSEEVKNYLALPILALDIVWIVCNLLLLISCAKNICSAGDEDQPAKPYRWGFLNRMGETYERNRQRAIDDTKAQAEAYLRRRQEKQAAKNHKKKK
jgi:signal transduction histidine kinase